MPVIWIIILPYKFVLGILLQKKPIVQLKAASAINRIMVLCDATLSLLNMLNLEVWDFSDESHVSVTSVCIICKINIILRILKMYKRKFSLLTALLVRWDGLQKLK